MALVTQPTLKLVYYLYKNAYLRVQSKYELRSSNISDQLVAYGISVMEGQIKIQTNPIIYNFS